MKCERFHVGDKGQRFEIHYIDDVTGEEKRLGWSNTREGAEDLANAMKSAPYVKDTKIIDRLAEGYTGI